jgi:PKD repeat protein
LFKKGVVMKKRSIILFLVILTCYVTSSYAAGDTQQNDTPVTVVSLAKIIASPTFGTAPMTVSFDASEFLYHYGGKLSFSWDFNDGSMSDEGPATKHTFKYKGTYPVALIVSTPFGPRNDWVIIVVN